MTVITCIGAGYVGGPTMAVFAKNCPDVDVNVVDLNQARIDQWNSKDLPIYEPGLKAVVDIARGRNLFFSTDVKNKIANADIIFVAINTPTKEFGEGKGKGADLQYWELTARDILKYARKKEVIVVEKSTLPVRAAHAMERILHAEQGSRHFEVVSNPEFLAEGTAINDLEKPDRVLIGSTQTHAGIKAANQLADLYRTWVSESNILLTNVWSSELSKLTANAMLAQRISSVNSISAICEKTEADITEVSKAIGMDTRIGSKFLVAGMGFGGSCFRKDILHLSYLADYFGLPEVANYWESVVIMNDYQINRLFKNILNSMFNTLANKKIALFGVSFKPDTSDTRDSPAIYLTQKLINEKALVTITDPQALKNAKSDLEALNIECIYNLDPYQTAEGAHAVVINTAWQEFKNLDYQKIYQSMEKPAFIFDGRNLLDHSKLFDIGFNVFPIGKSPLKHF